MFNGLVEAEFQVSCKREYVLGSRIKKRVCQAGYQRELLTRAAMWQSSGGAYNGDAAMAAKNSELSTKARELIETNAALRQAASRLSDLVEQYQDRYTRPD